MARSLELRVIVTTNDTRANAEDRLEDLVRAVLQTALGSAVYVERTEARVPR